MANLDESNINETIDAAIEKYWKKGMIVDAIFWSKVIGMLRDRIRNLENDFVRYEVRKGAGSSKGKSTGLKHQGLESR